MGGNFVAFPMMSYKQTCLLAEQDFGKAKVQSAIDRPESGKVAPTQSLPWLAKARGVTMNAENAGGRREREMKRENGEAEAHRGGNGPQRRRERMQTGLACKH